MGRDDMEQKKIYSAVDYPEDAYENDPRPIPKSVSFGFIEKENVVFSEVHGALVYFPNCKYPMKGLRRGDKIFASDSVKKYIKGYLSFFSASPMRYIIAPVLFLPPFLFKKVVARWTQDFADFCYIQTSRYWIKNEMYFAPPIREIQRVLFKIFPNHPYIVKTIVFIFSQDSPYLWRVMDIVQKLMKNDSDVGWRERFKKHPAREFKKLADTFIERDKTRNWKGMGMAIWFLVLLRPEIRKAMIDFVAEVDIKKFWFDDCDLYWCLPNDDGGGHGYNYLGWGSEERKEMHAQLVAGTLGK